MINPPENVPEGLLDAFTLQGRIPVKSNYINSLDKGGRILYPKDSVNHLIAAARSKATGTYPMTDPWLYEALDKYDIVNKTVAVIGSNSPWYEAICMSYGAYPVTVEYAERLTNHPMLRTQTVDEFLYNKELFDVIMSISSIEHDGLGRYGDPINPNGDIETMQKLRGKLKPNGLMFLGIPLGADMLVWNAHRIYGEIRLPMLIDGWELIDRLYYDDEDLTVGNDDAMFQPVLVLRNTP